MTDTLLPLATKYFSRLHLDPSTLDSQPSIEKLRLIHEAHLAKIPFENLSQHGCSHSAELDREKIAQKILDRGRGGFCYELNGLYAEFLTELGYDVVRIPAFVCADGEFRAPPSHLILVVVCQPGTESETIWCVDVGFGEPPINPLCYNSFDLEQVTPEGMRSKLVREEDDVIQYWLLHGEWRPRLKWNYDDSMLRGKSPPLSSFSEGLASVLEESSIFSRKLIVCLVTKNTKKTLAGDRFTVTGPPRFPLQQTEPFVQHLDCKGEEVRETLRDVYGMSFADTQGLNLTRSLSADKAPMFQCQIRY